MKTMKKVALMLCAVLAIGMMAGCGSFDASAYVKAVLDNSYKNDSTGYVDQKIATKEEAEKMVRVEVSPGIFKMMPESWVNENRQMLDTVQDVKSGRITAEELKGFGGEPSNGDTEEKPLSAVLGKRGIPRRKV